VRGGKIFDYFLQVGMWMVGWIFLQVFACDGVGCVIDSVVWERLCGVGECRVAGFIFFVQVFWEGICV
jgi:hypothetical protein